MKKKSLALMVWALLLNIAAFTSEAAPFAGQTIDGKLYVEPGTVYVAPNGIFLNVEGNLIAVNSICMDQYGVHVPNYQAVRMVRCPECGNYYDADNQSSQCRNGYHPWKCQRPS